jgi:hypothetical protein
MIVVGSHVALSGEIACEVVMGTHGASQICPRVHPIQARHAE